MEEIRLNISRDRAFVCAAMPYHITINNEKIGKIKSGGMMSLNIQNTQLTSGNALVFLDKSIEHIDDNDIVDILKLLSSQVID